MAERKSAETSDGKAAAAAAMKDVPPLDKMAGELKEEVIDPNESLDDDFKARSSGGGGGGGE